MNQNELTTELFRASILHAEALKQAEQTAEFIALARKRASRLTEGLSKSSNQIEGKHEPTTQSP